MGIVFTRIEHKTNITSCKQTILVRLAFQKRRFDFSLLELHYYYSEYYSAPIFDLEG